MLWLGTARKSQAAPYIQEPTEKVELAQTLLPPARILNLDYAGQKKLNLDLTKSYEQTYDSLIRQGIELAQKPESKQEAVQAFASAIRLRPEKAQKQLLSLDEKARNLYLVAMQRAEAPGGVLAKEETKKSKTWLYVLGAAAVAGIAVLTYELLKKKANGNATKVTLDFDVYNHTQGYLTHFARQDVSAGSKVTIKSMTGKKRESR